LAGPFQPVHLDKPYFPLDQQSGLLLHAVVIAPSRRSHGRRLAELGISEADVADAVHWARQS
jgi:hypothetical protein